MQIVIDIPEDYYKAIKEIPVEQSTADMIIIRNGILIPKGHGRLIDVNDLLDDINLEDCDYNRDVNMGEIITLENIDRIPTIIEADTDSEG